MIEASVQTAKLMAGSRGFVEADVRANAARIFDRVSRDPSVQRSNHLATAFATLDSKPRWRERLGQIAAPTLVIHGAEDPFFPVGNAEALAKEIPRAQLRVLDGIGQAMVRPAWLGVRPVSSATSSSNPVGSATAGSNLGGASQRSERPPLLRGSLRNEPWGISCFGVLGWIAPTECPSLAAASCRGHALIPLLRCTSLSGS